MSLNQFDTVISDTLFAIAKVPIPDDSKVEGPESLIPYMKYFKSYNEKIVGIIEEKNVNSILENELFLFQFRVHIIQDFLMNHEKWEEEKLKNFVTSFQNIGEIMQNFARIAYINKPTVTNEGVTLELGKSLDNFLKSKVEEGYSKHAEKLHQSIQGSFNNIADRIILGKDDKKSEAVYNWLSPNSPFKKSSKITDVNAIDEGFQKLYQEDFRNYIIVSKLVEGKFFDMMLATMKDTIKYSDKEWIITASQEEVSEKIAKKQDLK